MLDKTAGGVILDEDAGALWVIAPEATPDVRHNAGR
jgi:hypothetical protein